jgi:hypothetical protein
MTDDRIALEVRLHDAFRREGLPPAPAGLLDALDHVAEVAATRQVIGGRRRTGRVPWSALAIAAVIGAGLAWQLLAVVGGTVTQPVRSVPPSTPPATTRITYEPMWTAEVTEDDAGLLRIAAVLRLRLAAIGISDATAQVEGRSVVVEFPADADADAVRTYIGQTGRLVLAPLSEDVLSRGMPLDEAKYPALCDSEHILDADVATDQTGDPALQMKFDPGGAALLAEYTRTHVGSSFAIALDGKVLFTPMVVSEIPNGDLQVSIGQNEGLSAEQLSRLAAIIKIGPLPVPIREVAAAVGSQEPAPTPLIDSPSAAPSSPDPFALPSDIAPITICDDLPPRGSTLTCAAAVRAALDALPRRLGPPVVIDFVHTCFDPTNSGAVVDCLVDAFGVVTVTFPDGQLIRVGISLSQPPVILRERAAPSST